MDGKGEFNWPGIKIKLKKKIKDNIQANILKIKSMDMENFHGKMVDDIKDSGLMENKYYNFYFKLNYSMVTLFISIVRVQKNQEFGLKVKE